MTWIQTFSGKAFDLLDPKPEQVCIVDIAHHLALINRFTGATAKPYSVAQHSVLCSHIVPRELALTALLHDASEAYLTDVSRPLKEAMRSIMPLRAVTPYDLLALRAEQVIGQRYGVELVRLDPRVKAADMHMLATERKHLHHSQPRDWDARWLAEPVAFCPEWLDPWTWRDAELAFLARFAFLSQDEQS